MGVPAEVMRTDDTEQSCFVNDLEGLVIRETKLGKEVILLCGDEG